MDRMPEVYEYRPMELAHPNPKGSVCQSAGKWLYRLIRITLASVFIWSGASKLFSPQSFTLIIEAYGLVPDAMLWPVALVLCLAELAAGIGLLLDVQGALEIITGLLLLFMAILGYGLWLGLDVDCGCFGPDDPEGQAYHGLRPALYRDFIMLAGIGYLYFWRYRQSRRLSLNLFKIIIGGTAK